MNEYVKTRKPYSALDRLYTTGPVLANKLEFRERRSRSVLEQEIGKTLENQEQLMMTFDKIMGQLSAKGRQA